MEKKITFDEMPSLMADMLLQMKDLSRKVEVLTALKQNAGAAEGPRHIPIGIDEVVALSHKAKGTIYRLSSQGGIPCYKNGNTLVFFEDEIYEWLTEHRKSTSFSYITDAADQYCKTHPI